MVAQIPNTKFKFIKWHRRIAILDRWRSGPGATVGTSFSYRTWLQVRGVTQSEAIRLEIGPAVPRGRPRFSTGPWRNRHSVSDRFGHRAHPSVEIRVRG